VHRITQSLPILKSKIDQHDGFLVSLDDTATAALTLLGRKHVKLPHPSGMNRKLNNAQRISRIKNTLINISVGIIT
jgi:hypothetical protein